MTVHLYHFEPNANGGKPLIALIEKGVAFTSHWVDLLNWDQHHPDYLAINPRGQVPTLIHDGVTITESTPMGEYIDEAFAGLPLRPATAIDRARMRVWSRFGDEFLGPSLSMIAWHRFIAPMMRLRPAEELDRALAAIPTPERRRIWAKTIKQEFSPEELAESSRRLVIAIERLEAQLSQSEWLAGSIYSLADINLFNMSAALPMFAPDHANIERSPNVLGWLARISERPAVKEALAFSRNSLRGPN